MYKVVEGVMWAIATVFIFSCGIYYTYSLKGIQFRFMDMFKCLLYNAKSRISLFSSMLITLGGKVGVGSIAGIAIAVYIGGLGTIFWIMVVSIISIPIAFSEAVLGLKYQVKAKENYGGPGCYLSDGLHSKFLSRLYSYLIVFSFIGGFLSIQSNTIAMALSPYISTFNAGLIIALVSFSIIGCTDKISKISKVLVPCMLLVYFSSSLIIIFRNYSVIPMLISYIVRDAFNFKTFGLGMIVIGIQRGIFASEVGIGTGAISSSMVDDDYPARCGFVQMLGVYIVNLAVCLTTAIVVAMDIPQNLVVANGIELVQHAFAQINGGHIIVNVSIILFAFSTILSGYYVGSSAFKFLFSHSRLTILSIVTVIVLIIGAISQAPLLWKIVNVCTALLAIINCYALLKLRYEVVHELERYDKYGKIK